MLYRELKQKFECEAKRQAYIVAEKIKSLKQAVKTLKGVAYSEGRKALTEQIRLLNGEYISLYKLAERIQNEYNYDNQD